MTSVSLELPLSTFLCVQLYDTKLNGTYLTILFRYAALRWLLWSIAFRGSDSSSPEVQLATPDRAF